MLQKYPEIDYKKHPAFLGLFEIYKYDDNKISKIITNIDNIIKKASNCNNIEQINTIFNQEICTEIDLLVTYVKENIDSIIAFELFMNAINYVKKEVLKELIRGSYKAKYHEKRCDTASLKSMKTDGMYIANVNEDIKQKLYAATRPYYERLKKKAQEHPDKRSYENVKRFSKLSKCIAKLVKEADILPVISNYMQADMKIMGTGIEYSCPEQTWYKNPYPDIDNYQSSHNYLHVDEASYLPKTIYYLNSVNSVENGATKFIKGSHTAKKSNFIILFQKGVDSLSSERYFKIDDSYYRPLFKNIELRTLLAKLPAKLIGSSHLGDDIVAGSDNAKELSKNEVNFFSDGLDAIVFDGGNGLHKGANVSVGERLSLQIVYTPKNEYLVSRIAKKYKLSDKLKLILKQIRELFL